LVEKREQFLVAMPAMTTANDLAGRDIQRSKERCGAMPNVVVGLARWDPGAHGQERACPIEGLHLALLVQTDHDRVVGRIQGQADDVADLVDKLGVGRQLNVSRRCDCSPNVCQMREMVAFDRPTRSAIVRVLHCVAAGALPTSA
jgi:hypothetical protein